MIGVYVIRHVDSGKVYVGSSIDITRRLKTHLSNLRNGKHRNSHLQRAWDKHGERAFTTDILTVTCRHELVVMEQKWIDVLRAADGRYGYNACPIAGSVGSLPKSPEHRAKIGAAHKGMKRSEEAKARMSAAMSGKKRAPTSSAHREKLSIVNTGKVRTAAMRAHLSVLMTGVKKGPCTPERRAAISAAQKLRYAARRTIP